MGRPAWIPLTVIESLCKKYLLALFYAAIGGKISFFVVINPFTQKIFVSNQVFLFVRFSKVTFGEDLKLLILASSFCKDKNFKYEKKLKELFKISLLKFSCLNDNLFSNKSVTNYCITTIFRLESKITNILNSLLLLGPQNLALYLPYKCEK